MRFVLLVLLVIVGCASVDIEKATEDAAVGAVPMGAAKKR